MDFKDKVFVENVHFIFQLREYLCNITYDVFLIYQGCFQNKNVFSPLKRQVL